MNHQAAVIIPAAGRGTRMGTPEPKQYLELGGIPILVHTVRAFTRSPEICQSIVVVAAERVSATLALFEEHQVDTRKVSVVKGGLRRQDSVYNGLCEVAETVSAVLVHDGARPFISPALISRCLQKIKECGAAIAAVPIKDTIKQQGAGQRIKATLDRDGLWLAQTPQGAHLELLRRAYAKGGSEEATDEASLLERAGIAVCLVPGEEKNIKITRPDDLEVARLLINAGRKNMRIGHGFDAHRFAENRRLVLGGIEIPYHRGLAGHSDADVLSHALCDALLGALGLGDIGSHFPDSDNQYRGISSLLLLARVMELVNRQGLAVVNADITVVCEAPRLARAIPAMRHKLAARCRVEETALNIKATTTEKMGYTGRQEGISCHAVVLLGSLD